MTRAKRIEEAARAVCDWYFGGDAFGKGGVYVNDLAAALAAPEDDPALRERDELRAKLAQSEANCAALAESNENNNDDAERLTAERDELRARLEDARTVAAAVKSLELHCSREEQEAARRILAHPAPAPACTCQGLLTGPNVEHAAAPGQCRIKAPAPATACPTCMDTIGGDGVNKCPDCKPALATCELCGEPMPQGEEVFKFHGYSGPCPTKPAPAPATCPHCERGTVLVVEREGSHEEPCPSCRGAK